MKTFLQKIDRRPLFLLGVLTGLLSAIATFAGVALTLIYKVDASQEIRLAVEAEPPPLQLKPAVLEAADAVKPSTLGSLDWRAYDLSSGRVSSREEIQDGRYLILNLWATWCGPCLAEIPSLEKLRGSVSETDFEIAMLTWEPQARVQSFFGGQLPDVRQLVLRGAAPPELTERSLPQTYVLDPTGHVVAWHRGAADWSADSTLDALRDLRAAD